MNTIFIGEKHSNHMANISKLLREALTNRESKFKELEVSIHSFKDITDEMIPIIVSDIEMEGYNNKEDAIEDLLFKIHLYQKLPDPVTLYRVVGVKNEKMIKTDDMGEHFILDESEINEYFLEYIEFDTDDNSVPYIIEVKVPVFEIDIWRTIGTNLLYPRENEISLKNNGRGAKFVKAVKYDS